MYQLSVPFMLDQIEQYGTDGFIKKLKEIEADTVVLALDCYVVDEIKSKKVFDSLKENVPIFQKAGFKVGVWVWAFMIREENTYVHMASPNGSVSQTQVCPSDEDFILFAQDYLRNVAASNPDIIMFDDDFRYGCLDCGQGCACKNHRGYMSKILGEEVPQENLGKLIFSGGKNKYRSAFLQANGHYLKEFARKAREAVDSVNPNIRLGPCACMSVWDFDGVSAAELSRIMAGNTKPFLRLIGAPYWSINRYWGNRLQDVIELERMEASWCGEGIDLLAEGDAYPRPRFVCPANVLEGFDMALRATGALTGIHKYTLDYTSDPDYENGYNSKHVKNKPIYAQIEKLFADKAPVGVRVYETMQKFENMEVPSYYEGKDEVQHMFFSPAARMLATHAIPTVYTGLGTVGIAFGENVKYMSEGALDNGLILDVTAANILQRQGIDVGLDGVNEDITIDKEYFPSQNRAVMAASCPAKAIKVKADATIQSVFRGEKETYPVSYTYQNAQGQKFLVFAFDGYYMSEHIFKQYARGQQIEAFIAWVGKQLPASMSGNTDCYMLCKENATSKAVWIGNFFVDECLNTTVVLDKSYNKVEFINCTGTLKGNQVHIDEIAPYASVGFVVSE